MSGQRLHASLHHLAAREWSEKQLHASQLVYPLFVTGREHDAVIGGLEPNKQWGAAGDYATLVAHLRELRTKGLRSVMLFGVVTDKDAHGGMADTENTPVIACTKVLRRELPELMVMLDVCLCEYTDHGHCGLLRDVHGEEAICNKQSVDRLVQVSKAYCEAGAHWLCCSDMMDGRVGAIRAMLERENFVHVGIMAYTSKKASSMYAPFRAAVESTFSGDRKRYQQPVGSILHARQALARDEAEGASVVMVKPALFYGDIIKEYAERSNLPVACYVVSGEYVMLQDYAKRTGDLASVLRESHVSLLRSGASILVTYFTPELLDLIPTWA